MEGEIAAGHEPALLEQSRRATGEILDRFKERAGRWLLVAFPADEQEPFTACFRQLFAERGIPFLEEVPRAVAAAEGRGLRLRLPDGAHWNAAGHRIVGEALAGALIRLGAVPARPAGEARSPARP